MKSLEFDELIGGDVPAEERDRLRRVHDLLVAAGPPEELSPDLELGHRVVLPFGETRRRAQPFLRRPALLLAATLVLALAFFAGYVAGNDNGYPTKFTVRMHGTKAAPGALASLQLAPKDDSGNWPMRMTVTGLPQLPAGDYYVLFLTRKGKPVAPCGGFRVHGGATIVRMNAPYKLKQFDGWVVMRWDSKLRKTRGMLMRTQHV